MVRLILSVLVLLILAGSLAACSVSACSDGNSCLDIGAKARTSQPEKAEEPGLFGS